MFCFTLGEVISTVFDTPTSVSPARRVSSLFRASGLKILTSRFVVYY